MPRIVVRKGYRCLPGKRRELLAALQRVDAAATAAGWPRGRYLFVETRAPGEPDLEVEFTFDSYGEMEQIERRLREHLGRVARDVGSAGQELLLEPSATRYLLLLDEPAARPAADPARPGLGGGPNTPGPGTPPGSADRAPRGVETSVSSPRNDPGSPEPPAQVAAGVIGPVVPPPEPAATAPLPPLGAAAQRPALTLAQQRAQQLAEARAAMESAERSVGLPPDKRASQRQAPLSGTRQGPGDAGLAPPVDDDPLDATA